ncbi:MAG: FGGY-family carbohydrate kinase [Oscillospiraceae bacterium]|nr:FGGY-family carbohydrate kinase [Oscillospiraceae bacterium]
MPNLNQAPLVLTIDMGTQSARALLCDPKGNIVAKAQKNYLQPYISRQPGWAEQSADFYWAAICECCQKLKAEQEALWPGIIAVTSSTIRDSCVCLDEHMRPLRDIILWLDDRESGNIAVPRVFSAIFRVAGMTETVAHQRRVSACNWIAEHEPEIWAKTAKFVLLSAWLTHRLCGNLTDAIASTVGHVPFSNKHRTWMTSNDLARPIFDVRDEQCYDLAEAGTAFGRITEAAAADTGIPAGLPLIATGSDKACETLGLGCATPDVAALSFGSTATVEITTPTYMEPFPFIPPYCSVMPGYYTPEVEIFRGYWLISWFKKEFAALEGVEAERLGVSVEQLLNQRLQEVPPGCDGLIMHPYFTPGLVMPSARGSVIGFSDLHTRMHCYRSIIEGINFALMEGLEIIEKRGKLKAKRLMVAGGGSQSAEICQITANMFGLPLQRVHTHEVTGLGSSLVGFVAMGIHKTYETAVAAMVHPQEAFMPDAAQSALYRKIYEDIFVKVFDKLKPFYSEMKKMKG